MLSISVRSALKSKHEDSQESAVGFGNSCLRGGYVRRSLLPRYPLLDQQVVSEAL